MPLNPNALTSLEAVKSYIPSTTEADNQILEDLINACSSVIESYCERLFKEKSYVNEQYDGNGKNHLLLKQYPVKTVDSVTLDGVVLDSGQYKIKKNNGILVRANGIWPKDDLNIEVSYTAGYSSIPADLEFACRLFVKAFYKTDVAAFSTTFTDGFVFRADAIPVQVKLMLQPYKRVA